MSFGNSERGEAVEDGRTDLQICDLPIKVAGHDALSQQLGAVHFGLDAATLVIVAPASPDCLAEAARRLNNFHCGPDRATLYGAFLTVAAKLRSDDREQALVLWKRKGKRAFEAEANNINDKSNEGRLFGKRPPDD